VTSLRDLQAIFAGVVTGASPTKALESHVDGPSHRAQSRIGVYADAYLSRLHDVLREDYPRVAAVLADEFHPMAREYVRQHPSDHPSLRHLGRHLSGFLSHHRPRKAPLWLADLASLEWARVEAFDAADRRAMTLEDLQAIPRELWPELRLELMPSVRILTLSWAVDDIWLALDQEHRVPRAVRRRTTLVAWRNGFVVRHRACSGFETRAIARVEQLARFADVCDDFAGPGDRDVARAAQRAFFALRQWIADGWVASPGPGQA
jgi:hypothetical protein